MKNPDFNNRGASLPNFRSLSAFLRTALATEAALIFAAASAASGVAGFLTAFSGVSLFAQPSMLLVLLALGVFQPRLAQLAPPLAGAAVLGLTTVIAATAALAFNAAFPELPRHSPVRAGLFAFALAWLLLAYFALRERALSPALAEARLQALQARIRPHFLFNSLNAVLSLVRSDPRRAETALEDLSELFRALMADARRLVPLADEVELTRRYLEIEQLRLGERLRVVWRIDNMPADALVPQLVLQPLLENAVHHGVELAESGDIQIDAYRSRDVVHLVVRNPVAGPERARTGNHMALENIRERLRLHFDLDASLQVEQRAGVYQVHIVLPYLAHAAPPHR